MKVDVNKATPVETVDSTKVITGMVNPAYSSMRIQSNIEPEISEDGVRIKTKRIGPNAYESIFISKETIQEIFAKFCTQEEPKL